MEFGRLSPEELNEVDFTLPPDHPDTKSILVATGKKPIVHVGCAKWGRPDWVGKIYPKGSKPADFLSLYGKQFNCIELNSVFYQTPSPQIIESWYNATPPDFLFVPKFPQPITHLRRLNGVKSMVDQFLLAMSGLKEKMGPIFVMPEPRMGIKTLETIANFIREEVPRDQELFLELRHPDWAEPDNADQVFSIMKETHTGSVITDTGGRRDMAHMRLTTPTAFVRFVGNSLHATDYTRIDEWVLRIQQWIDQGLERLFFFMHQHDELYSPELIKYLIEKLNAACNLEIKPPVLFNENPTLKLF